MGQSKLFDRELVFTDASLSVAAARRGRLKIDPASEARRILGAFPGTSVTLKELVDAIVQMEARESARAPREIVLADMLSERNCRDSSAPEGAAEGR